MNESEKQKTIGELITFHKELKMYQRHLKSKKEPSEPQLRYRESLREILVRKVGALKTIVIELTGKEHIQRFGMVYNIWDVGLSAHRVSSICNVALDYCIDTVNEAIGILKHDINDGKVETQKEVTQEESKEKVGKETKLGDLLQQKLEQLRPMYSHGAPAFPQQHSESLIRWQSQVEVILRSFFGAESPQLKQFKEATSVGPNPMTAPDPFVIKAEATLEAILFELKISKPHKYRKVLQWIKAHKVLSILATILLILVTLLGTNWTTVKDNFLKLLEFFR